MLLPRAWATIAPTMSISKIIATLTIVSCAINIPVFRLKVEITLQPQTSWHLERLDSRYVSVGNILGSHLASGLILKRMTFLMNRLAVTHAAATGRRHPRRSQHRRWFTVNRTISGIVEILGLIFWILVDLCGKLGARWRGHFWAVGATYLDIRLRDLRSLTWKILTIVSYVILYMSYFNIYRFLIN